MGCAQKRTRNKNVKIHKKQTKLRYPNYWNSQHLVLNKWSVAKIHNYISFSCKRCFLSFHLKVKMTEDLIQSNTENHTFGPTNVMEHFPEEELSKKTNQICRWRWRLQANTSQPEAVLSLFGKFYLNPVCIFKTARAIGDRVNVWSRLCILRETNQYWNVK